MGRYWLWLASSEYVLKGLAEDFCSILKKEWVDTGMFKV